VGPSSAADDVVPLTAEERRDQCARQQEGRLDRILTVLDSMTDIAEFHKVRQTDLTSLHSLG
jgi:hypothetical protein